MTESTPIAFRYDFAENELNNNPCSIISTYLEYFPGILGVENHNKYGEEIKKHFHYHFLYPGDSAAAKKFVEKVRKRIQRANVESELGERAKGFYSLTAPDVKDLERWLRYPLKQVESFDKIFVNPRIPVPDGFDIKTQWVCATEEYIRDKEFLSCRREAADKRQTTYQKILGAIDEEKIRFKDERSVFDFVLSYYNREEIPLERPKIRSIVDSISMKHGILSPDEYYRLVMS